MTASDKATLSERDICTKYITPAVEGAGWRPGTRSARTTTSAVATAARGNSAATSGTMARPGP